MCARTQVVLQQLSPANTPLCPTQERPRPHTYKKRKTEPPWPIRTATKTPFPRTDPARHAEAEARWTGTSTPVACRTASSPHADTTPRTADDSPPRGDGYITTTHRTQLTPQNTHGQHALRTAVWCPWPEETYAKCRWTFMLRKSPFHGQRAQPNAFSRFFSSSENRLFCAWSTPSKCWTVSA